MRHTLTSLITATLMLFTLFNSASAAPTDTKSGTQPENLIISIGAFITKHAIMEQSKIMMQKTPDTEVIEKSLKIYPFTCQKEDLELVVNGFQIDMNCGYSFLHKLANEEGTHILNTGDKDTDILVVRQGKGQEMWLLNVKNPDNPSLRDNYTLVIDRPTNHYDKNNPKAKVTGTIYMITSRRPELINYKEENAWKPMTVEEVEKIPHLRQNFYTQMQFGNEEVQQYWDEYCNYAAQTDSLKQKVAHSSNKSDFVKVPALLLRGFVALKNMINTNLSSESFENRQQILIQESIAITNIGYVLLNNEDIITSPEVMKTYFELKHGIALKLGETIPMKVDVKVEIEKNKQPAATTP